MTKRLASGRHHLTRDEVAADQRRRLFKALAAVMVEKGYTNTTVEDLIKHAQVSRATFYQHFDSKQDCFMSGYARSQRLIIEFIMAVPEAGTTLQRFGVMLSKYLGYMAHDPATARLFLVEVYAAGPEAMQRRLELQQEFVVGVANIFKIHTQADRFACQALVAAISTLVTNALIAGDADAVRALDKPILEFAERVLGGSV